MDFLKVSANDMVRVAVRVRVRLVRVRVTVRAGFRVILQLSGSNPNTSELIQDPVFVYFLH